MKLSVVIPVFNEEKNIAPLYKELASTFSMSEILSEIIFVNDASVDQTLKEIETVAKSDSRVIIINLAGHHGQSHATMQGIQAASGDLMAFLDGDMQNDASELPKMVAMLSDGYDLICGWRKDRKDKWSLVFSSRFANLLIRIVFGIKTHDSGCSQRVAYSKYLKRIKYFEHFHRYIPIIFAMENLQIGEIIVNHRSRASGQSNYTIMKSFKVLKELAFLRFFY